MLPYMTKEGTSKIRISIYGPVNKLFLDQTDEYLTDLQFTATINLKDGSSWIRDWDTQKIVLTFSSYACKTHQKLGIPLKHTRYVFVTF